MRMLSGDGMWHTFSVGEIPAVRMSDGPNGLRMTDDATSHAVPATCFPTPGMLANSWDAAMCYAVGAAIGREATAMGVNLLLAPGLNIKRHPLGGRNFEYFSEDPMLSGEIGKAYIAGVQSTGVGACAKHFAANNQEQYRMYSDSVVDKRALYEIYLKPFKIALQAQPAAVMCAYNKLNGTYCSESAYLLKSVLRDEWKYDGAVISDWGAVHNRADSLSAGLDLAMPGGDEYFNQLSDALVSGAITDEQVNGSVARILKLVDDLYLEPYGDFDDDLHERIAYNAAAASLVLLKNDGLLPLTKNKRVAVCGELFDTAPIQGGGSSHITPLKSGTPRDAFKMRALSFKYSRGYSSNPKDKNLAAQAVKDTEGCDAVIVYVGQPTPTEGIDRATLSLPPEQDELIAQLTAAGRKVVVVLCSAGPVLMPGINRVYAVVYAGLNGCGGALAAVDAIYGRFNPSGRLAETFPAAADAADFGSDFGGYRTLYRESIFVGYRYYDAVNKPILFPFGHGLCYSEISYDDMHVKRTGDNEYDVTVTLTNGSARDAYETVQIYVADRTGRVMTPQKQLAGYAKVFIEGQSSTTATIRISRGAFEFYNTQTNGYSIPDGEFKIIAAASAGDIKKQISVKVNGDYTQYAESGAYAQPLRADVTDDDFTALYGDTLPVSIPRPQKGEFTLDCCLDDIKHTLAGRFAVRAVKKRAKHAGAVGSPSYESFMQSAMFTPLLSVSLMSDGAMPITTAKGLVEMANGNFFKGIKLILGGRKK